METFIIFSGGMMLGFTIHHFGYLQGRKHEREERLAIEEIEAITRPHNPPRRK
jgi:hypothetical protein